MSDALAVCVLGFREIVNLPLIALSQREIQDALRVISASRIMTSRKISNA